jgi:hypothetical protein
MSILIVVIMRALILQVIGFGGMHLIRGGARDMPGVDMERARADVAAFHLVSHEVRVGEDDEDRAKTHGE